MDFENKLIFFELRIAIPTGNNSAGISWETALTQSGLYTVDAGDIVINESLRFSSVSLTNVQRLAELLAYHETVKSQILAELQSKLKFTGYVIPD